MTKLPIKNLATITMGQSPSGDTYNKNGEGLPLLNGPTEFGEVYPAVTLFTKDSKRVCKKGDLIFCVRGSTTGRMNWADQVYSLGRGVCSISGKDNYLTKYIKYSLDLNLEGLLQLSGGGTFPNLSKPDIENYEISFNSNNYRRIAAILSAYDDLIENNLRRIQLLEEAARCEYKRMMEENELSDTNLESIWDIKYGKNLPQTKIKSVEKYPVYGAAGIIGYYSESNYIKPVALVTSRGNGSGVAHRTNQAAFVTNNSFAFTPKIGYEEVHFHLSELILRDLNLQQYRSGTAQPQLTLAGMMGIKVKIPAVPVLRQYNGIVDSIFLLLFNLEKQNTQLRQARDILLPKLMSGEIEV